MNDIDVLKAKIDEAITEIEKDDRRTPIATVFENAPLALVQVALDNQLRTLKWVKSILEEEKTDAIDVSFVNTSVEDLQSTLACAETNGYPIFRSDVLQKAFGLVSSSGEKTKARLIQRYIKKAIKKERMS